MKMWSLLTYVCLLTSYICKTVPQTALLAIIVSVTAFCRLKYSTAVIEVGSFRMISSAKCWHGM